MSLMQTDTFRLSRTGAIAEIVLCQGAQLNTFDDAFWGDLAIALDRVDAMPEVRVLLLRAEGPHFSAGMSLSFFSEVRERAQGEPGRYREWLRRKIRYLQRPMNQLEALRVPVIAATQGACVGAGLDLVCAADIRVCAADAFFCIHEINVAITADLGVLQRMPNLIAPAVVHEMALSGRKMRAKEALERGLVATVCADAATLGDHVDTLAASLAAHSPLAIAGTKAALRRGRRHEIADGLEFVSLWNAAMFIADDIPDAIQAQQARTHAHFPDLLP